MSSGDLFEELQAAATAVAITRAENKKLAGYLSFAQGCQVYVDLTNWHLYLTIPDREDNPREQPIVGSAALGEARLL